MYWTAKSKNLSVGALTAHNASSGVAARGRAPTVVTISFSPQELFGAMARCSVLHPINPAAVSFESEGCRHLISQHVDDLREDFFILPSARRLKDFTRTHMVGVVGAGLAYLQMIRDGYVWCDHFENQSLEEEVPTQKSPDFVFSRPGFSDVALTESKATSGTSRSAFQRTVSRGYKEQVAPYIGRSIGGSRASHGFSIGSWMTSPTRAELFVDYTAAPVDPGPPDDSGSPAAVRRGNYITAISLMFGAAAASAAREGRWLSSERRFYSAYWLGREWLLGLPLPHPPFPTWFSGLNDDLNPYPWSMNQFALELEVAKAVFKSLSNVDGSDGALHEVGAMDEGLMADARMDGGAIFPDGLAVLGQLEVEQPFSVLLWDPNSGKLMNASRPVPMEQVDELEALMPEPKAFGLEQEQVEIKPAEQIYQMQG